jgi:hypothetical protein
VKTLLTIVVVVLGAQVARADDWSGAWGVEGSTVTRTVRAGFSLAVELEGRPITLSGAATTGSALTLEGAFAKTPGIKGALEGEAQKTPKRARLDATLATTAGGTRVEARYSVDGRVVLEETWLRGLEISGLSGDAGPLAGALDVKADRLCVKYRVVGAPLALRAKVLVAKGHPEEAFYASQDGILAEKSLGVVEAGERTWEWNGRDRSAAERLALAGRYVVVIEEDRPAPPKPVADADGIGAPPPARKMVRAPERPALSAERTFEVDAPRFDAFASLWMEGKNQPEWNVASELDDAASLMSRRGTNAGVGGWRSGSHVARASADLAPMRRAASIVISTHGAPGRVALYDEKAAGAWNDEARKDRFYADGVAGIEDLHFAFVSACDSATSDPGSSSRSFIKALVDNGCDVAIGFTAKVNKYDATAYSRAALSLVARGAPVEKAGRDAAKFATSELGRALVEKTEANAVHASQVHALGDGMKSLTDAFHVERHKTIPADESAWPPRHGNRANRYQSR